MNFKKNQGRIPMNFKKIIPLSFAALSVAGALSACSDNKVVGADEQQNTMAERSSSSVVPGFSSSRQEKSFNEMVLAAIRGVPRGTAATIFHMAGDNFNQIDSVTAHETYDGVVQSILDYDVTLSDAELVVKYDTLWGLAMNSAFHAVMRDEDDVLHEALMYVDDAPRAYSVYCHETELMDIYNVSCATETDCSEVIKLLRSEDSTLLEQFKQDCALENGTLEFADPGFPEMYCFVAPQLVNGAVSYKDPNWKKYTKRIIEECEVPYDFYDFDAYVSNDPITY